MIMCGCWHVTHSYSFFLSFCPKATVSPPTSTVWTQSSNGPPASVSAVCLRLLLISHPDNRARSSAVTGSGWVGCDRVDRWRGGGLSESGVGILGPTVGCCSTYLGPRGVARGNQGGGALLHQIREIGVAREQISVAGVTIAGSRAPPPFPMFLEREKEGRAMCSEAVIDRSGDGGRKLNAAVCACVCFCVCVDFRMGGAGGFWS